jgi:hypothetical protein
LITNSAHAVTVFAPASKKKAWRIDAVISYVVHGSTRLA